MAQQKKKKAVKKKPKTFSQVKKKINKGRMTGKVLGSKVKAGKMGSYRATSVVEVKRPEGKRLYSGTSKTHRPSVIVGKKTTHPYTRALEDSKSRAFTKSVSTPSDSVRTVRKRKTKKKK